MRRQFRYTAFFSVLFVQRGRQKGIKILLIHGSGNFHVSACIRRESRFGHAVSARTAARAAGKPNRPRRRCRRRYPYPAESSAFSSFLSVSSRTALMRRIVCRRKTRNSSPCAIFRQPIKKDSPGHLAAPGESGIISLRYPYYLRGFLIAACAAARRAIGTRNGEQET